MLSNSVSLRFRVVVAAGCVLAVVLGVAGVAYERQVRLGALASVKDRLELEVEALIDAFEPPVADEGTAASRSAVQLTDVYGGWDLGTTLSGLFGAIFEEDGTAIWRSVSLNERVLPFPGIPQQAGGVFDTEYKARGETLFSYTRVTEWEAGGTYVFQVAKRRDEFDQTMRRNGTVLWVTLGAVAVAVVVGQAFLLVLILAPIDRIASGIRRIENGESDRLSESCPRELIPLTESVNSLIRAGRRQLNWYRSHLQGLDHDLRTPLAALRATAEYETDAEVLRATVRENVTELDDFVRHQLKRAAGSGRTTVPSTVDVVAVVRRIVAAMGRLYDSNEIEVLISPQAPVWARVNESDLMEVIGYLFEIAMERARSRVRVVVAKSDRTLSIEMEDDGPGVGPDRKEGAVSQSGLRPGAGITGRRTVDFVRELVTEYYSGEFRFERSASGGGRVLVMLDCGIRSLSPSEMDEL